MKAARLFLSILVLLVVGIGFCVFSFGVAVIDQYRVGLPDHGALASYAARTGSIVLAADGSLLARHTDQRRTFVGFDDIPDAVVQAFISAEDKNYWIHGGVDALAIARATLGNIATGRTVGASTITQQVAKNLIVGDEHSVARKIREAILAWRMDKDIGKERIIEIYLNEIYLGIGAYGIAAAADTFFSKTLDQLTIEEVALLAAMPKAPSAFDPRRNAERAKERRDYVLLRMVEDGALRQEDADRAIARPILLNLNLRPDTEIEVDGGWFAEDAWNSVSASVDDLGFGQQDVVLRTTLVPSVQAAAAAALTRGILSEDKRLGWRGVLDTVALPVDWTDARLEPPAGSEIFSLGVVTQVGDTAMVETKAGPVVLGNASTEWTGKSPSQILGAGDVILVDVSGDSPTLAQMPVVEGALVALDPRNGDVVALVGGFSHQRSVFDRATQAKRQPGSSFKPIVYLTALELGYDATSPLLDASITLEQGPGQEDWRPSDAKGAGKGGLITLRHALEQSRNMASVRLLWDIGLLDVANMSRRLGIDTGDQMSYAIGLGAGEVTPMQLAIAYGTMANGGHALTPRFASSLETKDGLVLSEIPSGLGEIVVDPVAAAQMTTILRGVVTNGTAKSAFEGFEGMFSGKTGTTNSSRDAWFAGYAGDLVVVAWIGRDDNRPLADGASGGKTAASIVRDFLDGTRSEFALEPVPMPADGVETIIVDPATGLQAAEGTTELVRAGWYQTATAVPEIRVEEGSYTAEVPPSPGYGEEIPLIEGEPPMDAGFGDSTYADQFGTIYATP